MKAMSNLIETFSKSCLLILVFASLMVSAHQASAEVGGSNRAVTEAMSKLYATSRVEAAKIAREKGWL